MLTNNNETTVSRFKLEVSLIGFLFVLGFLWFFGHYEQQIVQAETKNQETMTLVQKSQKRQQEILSRRMKQFQADNKQSSAE